jgi:hypothetical protein
MCRYSTDFATPDLLERLPYSNYSSKLSSIDLHCIVMNEDRQPVLERIVRVVKRGWGGRVIKKGVHSQGG